MICLFGIHSPGNCPRSHEPRLPHLLYNMRVPVSEWIRERARIKPKRPQILCPLLYLVPKFELGKFRKIFVRFRMRSDFVSGKSERAEIIHIHIFIPAPKNTVGNNIECRGHTETRKK